MRFSFLYLILLLPLFSCGHLGLYSPKKGQKVATVGEYNLYERDLSEFFSSRDFTSDSDSIVLVKAYVDEWIKSKALLTAATKNFSSFSDIDQRVEKYRNQLILYEFENSYVERNLDTVIDQSMIDDYYNTHKSTYRLLTPLVKCSIARIPLGVRQIIKFENLFISKDKEELDEFLEICDKNNYLILNYSDSWVDLSTIVKIIPFSIQRAEFIFSKYRSYCIEDDTWNYIIRIDGYLPSGSPTPIDMELNNIKRIILHSRRMQIRHSFEDSIINSFYSQGLININ